MLSNSLFGRPVLLLYCGWRDDDNNSSHTTVRAVSSTGHAGDDKRQTSVVRWPPVHSMPDDLRTCPICSIGGQLSHTRVLSKKEIIFRHFRIHFWMQKYKSVSFWSATHTHTKAFLKMILHPLPFKCKLFFYKCPVQSTKTPSSLAIVDHSRPELVNLPSTQTHTHKKSNKTI